MAPKGPSHIAGEILVGVFDLEATGKDVIAGCTVIFPKSLFDFRRKVCTWHLFLVM